MCIYVWAAVSRALGLMGQERRCTALPTPGAKAPESASRRSTRNSGASRIYRVEQDRRSGEWILVPES
jgi:hypothetical protein